LKELDDIVAGLRRRGLGQIAALEARDATVARLERVGLGQTAELEERDANVARLERVGVGQTAELVERDANVARLELTGVGQTEELEALDAFAYSVSHDLRTPLRAINGYAQALLQEHGATLAPEVLSDLDRIQKAATRMGSLIDDLLRLSRITRTVPVLTTVDLAAMAREICGRLAAGTDSARSVVWNIPEHAWVRADRGLVEIALENLLGNAWKFTANVDRAVISFSAAPSPEGQVFTLRDNGIGFDMTHVSRLFVPFSRLHSGKAFAGSGIGLAIVQRVVRRHGGRVWAESELNHGTAINFTLAAPAGEV
jgi:signal transduction histidine kinase